ncbi:glycosyltransferase family 39 protein [Methanobrevibacter sp.]|uniref:glycosyltransferase family 39 protein n=1 Tax=Methanobrevibacter sp. TaxID=66852 RepID=UPI00388E9EE2
MFDLDKKRENRLTLTVICIFALIITGVIIYLNSTHAILGHSYRDVYFYLIESLRLSGVSIGGYAYVNYLPPFVPFLTSILFRLGFVSETSIFITSGIFYFIGIIGMFKLLRLRFNNFYSFFGAFLYATLIINIKWVGNGTLDIPFVALMIWALYFFIQGMEKNQLYFYLAFPLGVLSFFTKYTGALIFAVMILYFMSRTRIVFNIKKYFKHISGGVIVGVITSIPFFAYFFLNNIPLGFLNQAQEVSSESSLTSTHAGQLIGNDLFYYFNGLTYNISANNKFIAMLLLIVMILGILLMLYIFGKSLKNSYFKIKDTKSLIYKYPVPTRIFYISIVISLVMVVLSFFTASLFSFVYSEMLLFLGMFILAYSLTKVIITYDEVDNVWLSTYPYLAINIAMVGLFLSYLIFFSAHLTKADRYFTSMAPGFIFIVTLSVEILLNRIKGIKFRRFNLKYAIPIILMLLMLFSTVDYLDGYSNEDLVLNERQAADWISDKEGIIFSDRGPIYTWYLQKEINYTSNAFNGTILNSELINASADYYIGMEKVNLTDYSPVKEFGQVTIYQRNN